MAKITKKYNKDKKMLDYIEEKDNIIKSEHNSSIETMSEELNNAKSEYTTLVGTLDEKLNNVKKDVYNRKFNPKLWHSLYVRNNLDDNKTSRDKTLIETDVQNFKEYGIEGLWIPVHIGYDSNTNDLYYQTNIDTLDYVFNELSVNYNIPIIGIKFHQDYGLSSIFAMGEDVFKTRMKYMFNEISDRYLGKFEYMGVFNEWRHFYKENGFVYGDVTYNYVPFVLECIEMIKAKGIKCGVSLAGYHPGIWSSWDECSKNVIDASSVILVNAYPSVGNKSSYSLQDTIDAWNNTGIKDLIEYSRIVYNGEKKIIITESGCADSFRSYFQPSSTTVCDPNVSESNGEAIYLYVKGMFESMHKNSDILEGITYWFKITKGGEKTKELIKEYLGVIK